MTKAIEKNPEDRYDSIEDLKRDLEGIRRRGLAVRRTLERSFPNVIRKGVLPAAVLLAIAAAVVWWAPGPSPGFQEITDDLSDAVFEQLTSGPARDLFPLLSPRGRTLFYSSDARGNWDIYSQPIGDNTSVNLTADCAEDDRQPAMSPDGRQLAFRSERNGGGIFLMDAEGRNVRQLTAEGYNPSWSPDGEQIVYTTGESFDPSQRGGFPSTLWVLDLSTGEKRQLEVGDAVQPSWSPNGRLIAFWGIHHGGQRDIWTVSADGGQPVGVTNDAAIDWNPVWSPHGRYLYFVSNRSGRMNLWRIRIEENSGRPQGPPQAVPLPAASIWYASFSQDARRMVYVQSITRTNIGEIAFDEFRGRTDGSISWATQGAVLTSNPDLSSDNQWLTFDSIGENEEDIYVLRKGFSPHRLTRDMYKDRAPRWSPDGKTVLFFSDRTGRYELWTINRDGTGLKQVLPTEGPGAQIGIWSPDGASILENRQWGAPSLLTLAGGGKWLRHDLPDVFSTGDTVWDWAPNGHVLSGFGSGIFIYDLQSGRYRKFLEEGERPVWLSDSRRLLFFVRDRLYLLDTESAEAHEIWSVDPYLFQSLGISRDRSQLYFSLSQGEANIWMASLPDEK